MKRVLVLLLLTMLPPQAALGANCGLASPAFCDTFTAPHSVTRAGQLDPAKWSVSRITNVTNPSQGFVGTIDQANSSLCDGPIVNIVPDNDVKVCTPAPGESPYFDELFKDGGCFCIYDFRPRQPFDFAGRTGTVVFDSDAKTVGAHAWWLELWLADQPVPAPSWSTIGVAPFPKNGVGIEFSGCGASQDNRAGVAYLHVVSNWRVTTYQGNTGSPLLSDTCIVTADGQRNHFEVKYAANSVEVWATDANGTNFRRIAHTSGLPALPLSRGYVNYEHVQYNAEKSGVTDTQHYEWANMGFDGPVLPIERGYDIPDALTRWRDGVSINLGYRIDGGGAAICCNSGGGFSAAPPLTLRGMDLNGATAATLNFNAGHYSSSSGLQYRANGGTWRAIPYPLPDQSDGFRAVSVPITLSDLHDGDNTIEFKASSSMEIANADVTLSTSTVSPTDTPTSTPTNTPVPPTSTPTITPTNTPVPSTPTSTPIPTDTPTSVPTDTPIPTLPPTNTPVPTIGVPAPPVNGCYVLKAQDGVVSWQPC